MRETVGMLCRLAMLFSSPDRKKRIRNTFGRILYIRCLFHRSKNLKGVACPFLSLLQVWSWRRPREFFWYTLWGWLTLFLVWSAFKSKLLEYWALQGYRKDPKCGWRNERRCYQGFHARRVYSVSRVYVFDSHEFGVIGSPGVLCAGR